MTADPASPPSSAGAPAAFLRGVERRAALFAELQGGDPARGDTAVAAALRAFARVAATTPMAAWPVRFWSLLLAAPDLRRQVADVAWPVPWSTLGSLGNGPRAALLLRLVGGLEMDDAAAALGVPQETYRAALQRAIPYRDDGTPDRDAWQTWVAEVRTRVEGMPPERLARLHRPEQVAASASSAPVEAAAHRTVPLVASYAPDAAHVDAAPASHASVRRRHRFVFPLVAIVLCLVGAGVAVMVLRPHWLDRIPGRGIHSRELPPAEAPAARYDADLAAWSHRDFLPIADADGARRADDLPFFAWYAAQLAVQPAPEAGTPAAAATIVTPAAVLAEPEPVFVPPPGAHPLQAPVGIALPPATASAIARVPAALQGDLRTQATLWSSWSPAQRSEFVRRAAEWNGQPLAQRAQRRERYDAWRRLDAVSAEAVENAAQAFARQAPDEQARLRREFDALDPTTQRGWLLGPAIGADYPKLQPLLAQMPEAQHAPMLRVLHRMSSAERADLAVLAQRVPPQERAELVRNLLSTSDDNRAAWLRARLDQ